jgi:pimeloyl-ACP methyl ester carboxylesterase
MALWMVCLCTFVPGCTGSTELQPEEVPGNAASDYYAPGEKGPYGVGIRRFVYENPDRYHFYGRSLRTYVTTVWYPALPGTGHPNTLGDCMGPLPDGTLRILGRLMGDSFDELGGTETGSLRDALLDRKGAPYPVLFFSHGVSSNRFQSWVQCEHLASHGFVVVAPDHYGSALLANMGDRVVFFNPAMVLTDMIDRPADVDFFYGKLGEVNADPAHLLHQALDLSQFGILGHSWGGFTCLSAAPKYGYVKSMAAVAPIMALRFPQSYDRPFFLLQNDTDDICDLSLDSNRRAREAFTTCESSSKLYVRLRNAGHFTPSNVCDFFPLDLKRIRIGCEPGFMDIALANRITATYLTAFFKVTLGGDDRYETDLEQNLYPAEVEHFWAGSPSSLSVTSFPLSTE